METDGLLVLILLPMREVLLWPIRLSGLLIGGLGAVETEGLLALIGLPIREVLV